MKAIKVKDVMIPLAECETFEGDTPLLKAALALEEAQKGSKEHRALLVIDKNGEVLGMIDQIVVLRGLEPGYGEMGEVRGISRSGFSREFIKSMIDKYSLWESALGDICRKAADIKVKEIIHTPTEHEYIEEDTTLDQAVHQLVMGGHESLLVQRLGKIVGIVRLGDVYAKVCDVIRACAEA